MVVQSDRPCWPLARCPLGGGMEWADPAFCVEVLAIDCIEALASMAAVLASLSIVVCAARAMLSLGVL